MSTPVVHYRRRIGRLWFGLTVYHHQYPTAPDRWVFQPSVIYERKDRR